MRAGPQIVLEGMALRREDAKNRYVFPGGGEGRIHNPPRQLRPAAFLAANPAAAWYYLWSDKYMPSVIQLTRGRELNVISRNLAVCLGWVICR
jgi:hypothetical protein